MASKTLNVLLKANKSPVCLNLIFADYDQAKKAQGRAKQSGKLRRSTDGKEIPTPNEVVRELAKKRLAGDYRLASTHNGSVQELVFADDAEADRFVKEVGAHRQSTTPPKPFGAVYNKEIRLDAQIRLAEKLGLM